MKKIVLLSLLSLTCACALPAQTFNMDRGRGPVASVDGLGRLHTGDNPGRPSLTLTTTNFSELHAPRPSAISPHIQLRKRRKSFGQHDDISVPSVTRT